MSGEIDSRVVTYRGVKFRVDIDPDEESRPDDYGVSGTGDAAYTDADMEAWRRDEWQYVCVTVSIASTPYDLGLWDSLCSVEWGRLSEVTIGMEDIIRNYLPDLASEVIGQVPERNGNRGAEMTSHFHYGHAVTGHSPDAEYLSTCLTLRCLADFLRTELDGIGEMLADEAYAQEA